MSGRTGPPIRRTGPLTTGPSSVEVAANDTGSVAQASDDPVEAAHPGFPSWQRSWRCRVAASRRLAPLDSGVADPEAPGGGGRGEP